MEFPRMVCVKQSFVGPVIADIEQEVTRLGQGGSFFDTRRFRLKRTFSSEKRSCLCLEV